MPTRDAIERVVRAGAPDPARRAHPGRAGTQLTDLPFTVKEDLREHYPLGLVTVPHDELRRIHASSGSRGKPTVVAYNQHDLDMWSEVMAYCMTMAGVKPGMVVHNAYGYGLFTGGLGFHQGAERLGALTIPVCGGVTARQALLLRDLAGPGAVLARPPTRCTSRRASGRPASAPTTSSCRSACSAPSRGPTRCARSWKPSSASTALNIYGLSEIVGPASPPSAPRPATACT